MLNVAVPEVFQERLELLDARLVVFEFRVDLEPAAGREHDRFPDHFVIPKRDQGFAHAGGGERVALAHVYGSRLVRETQAN